MPPRPLVRYVAIGLGVLVRPQLGGRPLSLLTYVSFRYPYTISSAFRTKVMGERQHYPIG